MLGMIGILGCAAAAIIAAVVGVATVVTTVCVNHAQMDAQEEAQNRQETLMNQQQADAEKKALAQRNAAYNQQEKTNLANLMAMGSAVMVETFRTRKIKFETVKAMNAMGGKGKPVSSSNYAYGNPVNASTNSSQAQNQNP